MNARIVPARLYSRKEQPSAEHLLTKMRLSRAGQNPTLLQSAWRSNGVLPQQARLLLYYVATAILFPVWLLAADKEHYDQCVKMAYLTPAAGGCAQVNSVLHSCTTQAITATAALAMLGWVRIIDLGKGQRRHLFAGA